MAVYLVFLACLLVLLGYGPYSIADPSTRDLSTECDPNYSAPCVPVASDVDCAGGSGNGPTYLDGPIAIEIIGEDIYDLDRDNDGIACESPPR